MQFERVTPGDDLEAHSYPDNLGLRSKLGGDADWIQENETPACNTCEREMTFLAQIDSFEHDWKTNPNRIDALSGEQDYMFGDVGMLYVFLCFECLQSKTVVQCF
jgi:uncharacterized protein YwqG